MIRAKRSSILLILAGTVAAGAMPQPRAECDPSTSAQAGERRRLQWRVSGGAEALEETVRISLRVSNELRSEEASERFGMVQTAAYLFEDPAGAVHPVARITGQEGLAVVRLDPDLIATDAGGVPLFGTLEPIGIDPADYALGLVLGRPVRLISSSAREQAAVLEHRRLPPAALRVDQRDLEDRRRWSADTLVLPGQSRTIWDGSVPLRTNRIYADYLVVRPARVGITGDVPRASVADGVSWGNTHEGGILDLPPRSSPVGVQTSVTLGPTLARPAGRRIFPISLTPGGINLVHLRAGMDPAGSYRIEVEVTVVPSTGE